MSIHLYFFQSDHDGREARASNLHRTGQHRCHQVLGEEGREPHPAHQ